MPPWGPSHPLPLPSDAPPAGGKARSSGSPPLPLPSPGKDCLGRARAASSCWASGRSLSPPEV
eukprot:6802409-Alexandrium_andersonii.AAC.1